MTTAPERSVPRVNFTDAEAGAKEFPDSDSRNFNYYTPQKRKQSHYEDMTVALPRPGLALRLRRRCGRLPARVDGAQGVGF